MEINTQQTSNQSTASTMDEKQARIRLRRERIRRRYEDSLKESNDLSRGIDERITSGVTETSERQIFESLQHLAKVKKDYLDSITSFRISVTRRENDRRVQEEIHRESRYQSTKQQNDVVQSSENETLKAQWDLLKEIDNPMEQFEAMERIQALYQHSLNSSDMILNDLRGKLIQKDEAFIENLRNQAINVNQLQETIDKTKLDMQTHYCDELKSIEEAFVDDRTSKMQNQANDLSLLVQNKMKSLELRLEELLKRRNDKQKIASQHQDEAIKTYNELKTSLYNQVNKIECDLAISKGMYAANSDQIEYNLRATVAKNKESEEKIKKKKKRITQYKEELNKELHRSKELEIEESKRNEVLDDDCTRLEGQFKNLMDKLHRFEIVEEQKYFAAEAMHQEDIIMLLKNMNASKKKILCDFGIRLVNKSLYIVLHRALELFIQLSYQFLFNCPAWLKETLSWTNRKM